ncbi:MAG TPA: hypothetical protein VIM19_18255, partial [Actinomycetes bacterium]
MTIAHGVEKAVECREEAAFDQTRGIDDVDAHLEADRVRGEVPDRPGHELVEMALTADAQVEQRMVGVTRHDRRPSLGGTVGLGALADQTAVVQPERSGRRSGSEGRTGGHPDTSSFVEDVAGKHTSTRRVLDAAPRSRSIVTGSAGNHSMSKVPISIMATVSW